MKKRQFLAMRLLMSLLAVLTATTAWAYGIASSGSCGTNANYVISGSDGNYTLTISVANPNANGSTGTINGNAFYYKNLMGIKAIVINEGITSIGNHAFRCPSSYVEYTSVSIPASVSSIGEQPFQVTDGTCPLSTVNIASGSQLTSIPSRLFYNTNLERVVLPCPALNYIGERAFRENGKLTEIICLTETKLGFYDTGVVNNYWPSICTVYMLGGNRVDWPYTINRSLVRSIEKGTGITTLIIDDSQTDKKVTADHTYYVGGSTVTLTLGTNLTGDVSYFANGQKLTVTNGQATLTLPTDVSTITITAMTPLTLTNGSGTSADPYQIATLSDWQAFASMVAFGTEANKYYELKADIGTTANPITTMIGSKGAPFRGTLRGNNKTLTFNLSSTTNDCAPFVCISGATIQDLNVTGTISTSGNCAASIAAHNSGSNNAFITNCHSTMSINASGGFYHAGFISKVEEDTHNLTFTNCTFKGMLLGPNAANNGGFVAALDMSTSSTHASRLVRYNNCLFAPTGVTMGTSGSNTFDGTGLNDFTDAYYTTAFGGVQGKYVSPSVPADFSKMISLFGDYYYYPATTVINGVEAVYSYTGEPVVVTPTSVSFDGSVIDADCYTYNITDEDNHIVTGDITAKGTYTLTVSGVNAKGYYGSKSISFQVLNTLSGNGNETNPYLIGDMDEWNLFLDMVNANYSAGKYFKLSDSWNDNNVVTTMAGTSDYPFKGTFDGNGKTLNVNLTSEGEFTAPFRFVDGATIKSLHTTGTVTGQATHKYASGLVGQSLGTVSITNCRSSVTIVSSVSGDGTHGGFVGVASSGTTNIEGCVFDGTMYTTLSSNGTSNCGGFVGWRNNTLNIKNSLYAPNYPATLPDGCYLIGTSGSSTFSRNIQSDNVDNCYYSESLGSILHQGKQLYNIKVGNYVTLTLSGTATEYSVSGITAYADNHGLRYGDAYCAGEGDVVSLTLGHNNLPDGFTFSGYVVNKGQLSGQENPYTLTMPGADVKVMIDGLAEYITATLQVVWDDYNNMEGKRPSAVTAMLSNNTQVTLHADNNWTVAIENLPAFDDQEDMITYTWTAATPEGYIASLSTNGTVTTLTFRWDNSNDFVADGDTYTINSAIGWEVFCDMLADNDKGIFDGKTVKLGTDIPTAQEIAAGTTAISRMAGSSQHDFTGIFDGQQHTLTFGQGSEGTPATEQYIAPFRYITNNNDVPVTIRNLHVKGDIYTSAKYAAGIAAQHWGTLKIENCRSSIVIHSSITGDNLDGTHGGIEAVSNGVLNISGCMFDGKIISTGTTATTNCGGFVGWRAANANHTFTNSLFAPADDANTVSTGCYTFMRNPGDYTTITNCYYTRTLGTAQGKQAYTITAGNKVTLGFSGEGTEYNVSGITAYATGIKYSVNNTDVYYAGPSETVGLTLSHGDLDGYTFADYIASAGTLSGNNTDGYSLTMPDAGNVTIKATWNTSATVQVAWADLDDRDGLRPSAVTATLSDNTEVTLNAGNSWTATVENLPAFDASDQPIAYTWTADAPEYYSASASTSGTVTTLTFSHTPTMTIFTAEATNTFTTWCDADAWLTPEGCTVFTVSSVADGTVKLQQLDDQTVIPAYTPVIIRRNATGAAVVAEYSNSGTGTEGIQVATGTTGCSFYGTTTALNTTNFAPYYTYGQTYVLYGGMFLLYDTNNGVPAHRCWLNVGNAAAARLGISFGETTSIIDNGQLIIDNYDGAQWYTLDGRKLDKQPTKKGIYLYGGRKTIVK